MKNLEMLVGLDIGNGYTKGKGKIGNKEYMIDLPSVAAFTITENLPKEINDKNLEDFVNKMDININSKSIREVDNGRLYLGTRAITSGASNMEFDIESIEPKSNSSLSSILILGSIAGTVIEHLYNTSKKLDDVTVNVTMGVALPIEDYMEHKDGYRNKFMEDKHVVVIHNFDKDIYVNIIFDDVVVLAEGAAAQYAITNLGEQFLDLALKQMQKEDKYIEGYTGKMLAQAMNTIGVDVGEGTVNFPVFVNGNISIENSSSIKKGYGTVLQEVVKELRNTNYSFGSRKDLADFMLKTNLTPAQKFIWNECKRRIDNHARMLVREILKEYNKIFRESGVRTEVIYVYGGGANSIKEILYDELKNASKLDESLGLPVVYIDSKVSRNLNRNGLFNVSVMKSEINKKK